MAGSNLIIQTDPGIFPMALYYFATACSDFKLSLQEFCHLVYIFPSKCSFNLIWFGGLFKLLQIMTGWSLNCSIITYCKIISICSCLTPNSGGKPRSPSRSPRLEESSKIPISSDQQLENISSRSPANKELYASKHGRDLSRSRSPGGTPKRVRKGRGFTERFAFVRKYRTPSPERSPDRSYRYGGRNFQRNHDR